MHRAGPANANADGLSSVFDVARIEMYKPETDFDITKDKLMFEQMGNEIYRNIREHYFLNQDDLLCWHAK